MHHKDNTHDGTRSQPTSQGTLIQLQTKFGFKCALDSGINVGSNIVLADAMKVHGEVELCSPHTFIIINL